MVVLSTPASVRCGGRCTSYRPANNSFLHATDWQQPQKHVHLKIVKEAMVFFCPAVFVHATLQLKSANLKSCQCSMIEA